MSQLNEYLQEILDNAQRTADEIIAQAEREATKIIEDAKRQAEEIARQKVREYIDMERNKLIDRAIREQLNEKAQLKYSIMKRLNDFVLEILKERIMSKNFDYPQFLFRLLIKGIKTLGTEDIIVLANSRDLEFLKSNLDIFADKLRDTLGTRVKITLGENIETLGGLIIMSSDGTKSFNATLEGLAKHYIYLLEPKLIKRLGLITQNRFRSLIKKLFEQLQTDHEIVDANGNKILLKPCSRISELYTSDARADIICENDDTKYIILATIGKLNKEKLEKLLNASRQIRSNINKYIIAITFAGVNKDVIDLIRNNNVFVLTKKELMQLDSELNAHIFN